MKTRIARALRDPQTWIAVRVFVARGVLATLAGLAIWTLIPAAFGWNVSAITSGSMAPTLRPGVVVAASPIAHDAIQAGQIVTVTDPARDDGGLLTHRVVRIHESGALVTRGDANNVDDSTHVTGGDAWLGRLVVPLMGMPRLWLTQGNHLPLVASAIGVAVLALASVDRSAQRKNDRRGGGTARAVLQTTAAVVAFGLVAAPITGSAATFTAQTHTSASWHALPAFGRFGTAVQALDPAAFLRLEDASVTRALDWSGNGNHGTIIGAPTVRTAGALRTGDGYSTNYGFAFNGNAAIVTNLTVTDPNAYTVTGFFRMRNAADINAIGTTIFELVTPSGSIDRLYIDGGYLRFQSSDGGPYTNVFSVNAVTPIFFTMSVSGDTATIAYGGVPGGSLTTKAVPRTTSLETGRPVFGTRNQPFDAPGMLGTNGFSGILDELAVFDRALYEYELTSLLTAW